MDAQVLGSLLGVLARVGVVHRDGDRFSMPAWVTSLIPMMSLEADLSRPVITRDALIGRLQGVDGTDPMLKANQHVMRAAPQRWRIMRVRSPGKSFGCVRSSTGITSSISGDVTACWSSALLDLRPGVCGVVVDRPALKASFKARAGTKGAFRFRAGDLLRPAELTDELSAADVVVLSNVAHLMPSAVLERLLAAIRSACSPSTRLATYDQFAEGREDVSAAHLMVG